MAEVKATSIRGSKRSSTKFGRYWQGNVQFKHSKLFLEGPCDSKSKLLLKLNKLAVSKITVIYGGQYTLNYHIFKLNLSGTPLCRF